MDGKDDRFVEDILVHLRLADRLVAKGPEAFFDPDEPYLFLAAKAIIIDISSAASLLSPAYRASHQEVPWVELRLMRDKLAHHYQSIERRVVWDTLRYDLPTIGRQLTEGS